MEAIKELKEINLIDSLRYEHELRLKARRDREAQDEYVYEQGKEEGMKLGKEEGVKSLINSMREIKATDEQIINTLMKEYGLRREDVEEKLRP